MIKSIINMNNTAINFKYISNFNIIVDYNIKYTSKRSIFKIDFNVQNCKQNLSIS